MMNLRKTADEINRLRKLVANQKDTIEKALKVIEQLADDNIKLQDENKHLKDLVEFHKYMRTSPDEIIFPNTDERGLGDGDTPTDLSPLDL
jgi:regulator of replication initiation timing